MKAACEVSLTNVSRAFGAVTAVDRLNVEIETGEFFAVVGPSGCGKTTTLRIIAGLEKPSAGDVLIRGEQVTGLPPYKRNIGMVFQDYALFPHMTVFDNITFGLKMRRWSTDKRAIRHRVGELLELIRLPGVENRYPRQLSGGQQQRVALARALAPEPAVLLLDEPLSNLDLKLRQELRLEIRRIHKALGITTVFVTHDQGEALSLSDRLMVMKQGRCIQLGAPAEVYEGPRDRWVASFLGDANVFSGVKDGEGAFVTSAGMRFVVRSMGELPSGENLFAMRPESIDIFRRQADVDVAHGTVCAGIIEASVYLGAGARYVVRLADYPSEMIYVDVARPELSWGPGTQVKVLFPRHKWILLQE